MSRYQWKDTRKRHRVTWGDIRVVIFGSVLFGLVEAYPFTHKHDPVPAESDAERALAMQCAERGGTTAFSHGPHGEWVECVATISRKHLWSVKL